MTVLLVAVGAALGAPTRFLVDRAVQRRHRAQFPWGTATVNMAACLLLGLVTGGGWIGPDTAALVGTGFCGALSTYSTFSVEAMQLAARHQWVSSLGYVVGSVLGGLAMAAAGWWLGSLT